MTLNSDLHKAEVELSHVFRKTYCLIRRWRTSLISISTFPSAIYFKVVQRTPFFVLHYEMCSSLCCFSTDLFEIFFAQYLTLHMRRETCAVFTQSVYYYRSPFVTFKRPKRTHSYSCSIPKAPRSSATMQPNFGLSIQRPESYLCVNLCFGACRD
jgi:hypothetical protein